LLLLRFGNNEDGPSLVTVGSGYGRKTTQIGGFSSENMAQMMLSELAEEWEA